MIRQTIFTLFCFSVMVCLNGYNIEEVHTNPGWIMTHAHYYDTEKPPVINSDEEVTSEGHEIINKIQQKQPEVQEDPENLQNNWKKDIDEIKLGDNKYHILLITDKKEMASNDKIEEDILDAVRNGSLTKISKKDFGSLVDQKEKIGNDDTAADSDGASSSKNVPASDAISPQLVIDNIATYFRQVYGRSFEKYPEADAEIIKTEVTKDEIDETTNNPDEETNSDGGIDINGGPYEENDEGTENQRLLSNVNGKEDDENASNDKETSGIVKTNANERLEFINTLLDIINSAEKYGYNENQKLHDLLLAENIKMSDTNSLTDDDKVSKDVTIDEDLLNEIFSVNKAHGHDDDIDHINDIDMKI